MQIANTTVYENPNFFLPAPTILLLLSLGDLADLNEEQLARSAGVVSEAIAPTTSTLAVAGESRRPPAWILGDYIAQTALVLQKDYLYATERATVFLQAGQLLVAYEYRDREFALMAGRHAVALWELALANDEAQPDALIAEHKTFKQRANAAVANPGIRFLLQEAERRNIPAHNLLGSNMPIIRLRGIIQLGQGSKQRRFLNGLSSETSAMAYELASYKPAAAQLFDEYGIPTPRRAVVDTEEQAVAIARQIGFPVVLKPINQDKGAGVQIGIAGEAELRRAFPKTRAYGAVQVERHLPGFDYRFTFVRGALLGVLCTKPPSIVGDGEATVRQLLEAGPVKTATSQTGKVIIDDEVLGLIGNRGYALDDILPAGESILLRQWWRHQNDHSIENVTAITHHENIAAARLAVQIVGLDVAGVDYIATDISRPYHETGGAFTEVNPMPALVAMQACGMPAYRMLIEALFPPGDDGRIPTALFLGTRDDELTIAAAMAMLTKSGHIVGAASRTRLEVGGTAMRRSLPDDAARARLILRDPRPTAALLQTTVEAIARQGTPIDQCDVGIILLPADASDALPALAAEASVQAAALVFAIASKALVLNCDDPRVPALLSIAGSKRIFWVMDKLDGPVGSDRRRPGDATIAVRWFDGRPFVVMIDNQIVHRLAPAPAPMTQQDEAGAAARRAGLVATAIACAMGSAAGQVGSLIGAL